MKIRQGKDIMLRWKVLTNGQEVSLGGRNIALVMTTPLGREKIVEHDVEGSVVVVRLRGTALTHLGDYTLTLWENRGEEGQTAVDAVDAFSLVQWSTQEDDGSPCCNLEYEVAQLATASMDVLTGDATVVVAVEVVDSLDSTDSTKALSANMGRKLSEDKQDALTSYAEDKDGVTITTPKLNLRNVTRIHDAVFEGLQTQAPINLKGKTVIETQIDSGELRVLHRGSPLGFILRTVENPNDQDGLYLVELLSTDGYSSHKYTFPPKSGEVATKEDVVAPIVNQTQLTVEIQPNVLNVWGEVRYLELTFAYAEEGKVNEYMVQFTSGATATTLTLPNTIKWMSAPNIQPNKTYQLSVINNLGVIGEFGNE